MNDQFDLVRELFLESLDISDPAQRKAFVDQRCAGQPTVLAELEGLLDAHEKSGGFFDDATIPHGSNDEPKQAEFDPTGDLTGQRIHGYRIRERLGEGGMGTVYVAEQSEPVKRKVAIKVIRPGMATSDVIGRFQAERQALAMMDHPNIASIHDAGTTLQGLPYFVMELVRGAPIDDYADEYRLTTVERLRLFQSACNALQHAHLKGIIHRDLKPNNVLVTRIDGEHTVKVIDFGVAKATSQRLTEKSIYTRHTQIIGTPMYMSPEQAQFSGVDVDTRSDVYSLGVLLYRLLSGCPPFESSRFSAVDIDEVRRIIREEDPPLPSEKVSTLRAEGRTTISSRHRSEPGRMANSLRGELDWIVMKAMDKARDRRYESASALAADIDRFLNGDAVLACPPSTWYRFRKFAKKHVAALTTSAILLTMLLVTVGVSLTYATRAERSEQFANEQLRRSQSDLTRTLDALNSVVAELTSAEAAVDPAIVAVREKTLERVMAVYKDLALDHSEAPDLIIHQAEARRQIAVILSVAGRTQEAHRQVTKGIDVLETLHRANPDNLPCSDQLVELLAQRMLNRSQSTEQSMKDAERALAISQDLLSKEPNHDRCQRLSWAAHYIASRLPEDSSRAQTLMEQAVRTAELNGTTASHRVYAWLAGEAVTKEDFETAESHFRTSLRLIRTEQEENRHHRRFLKHSQYCTDFALFLNQQGRSDEALKYFVLSIDVARSLHEQYGHLATHRIPVQYRLREFAEHAVGDDQIAAVHQQMLEDTTIWLPVAHSAYAKLLFKQEDREEQLAEAVERFPGNLWYLLYHYEVARQQGNGAPARKAVIQAMDNLDRDVKDLHEGADAARWELFRIANKLHDDGDPALAIAFGESLVTLSEEHVMNRMLYQAHNDLGHQEQALRCISKAMLADPSDRWLPKRRAVLHWQLGMEPEMLEDLRIAITIFRDHTAMPWLPLAEIGDAQPETKLQMIDLADRLIELTDGASAAYAVRGIIHYCFGNGEQSVADIIAAARRPAGADRDIGYWLHYDRDLKDAIATQSTDPEFVQAVEKLVQRYKSSNEGE